jgi:hypothetical protein
MLTNLGVFALFADSSEDTIPPGTVTDLSALTGTNGWRVDLRWTATGDDGNVGTATSYILKFSQSEITSSNWDSCAAMGVGFAPHVAGTVEDALLQMPDPGATYFFAIRAQDEAGNLGPMSNVATARSYQLDTDGDTMPDQWEATYGLNPDAPSDADADADADGLTNLQEFTLRTNPTVWDTDGDGMGDAWEVQHGLDPRSAADRELDNDGDGLSNFEEHQHFTDPNQSDTDGDGLPDKWELDHGLNPRSVSGISSGEDDPDGDHSLNYAEFVANTDPQDPASFLHIKAITLAPGGGTSNQVQIIWTAATNRLYVIQRSVDLAAGFSNLVEHIASTPPENVFVDRSLTNGGSFFYRIKVE